MTIARFLWMVGGCGCGCNTPSDSDPTTTEYHVCRISGTLVEIENKNGYNYSWAVLSIVVHDEDHNPVSAGVEVTPMTGYANLGDSVVVTVQFPDNTTQSISLQTDYGNGTILYDAGC